MERPNAWKKYDDEALAELDGLCRLSPLHQREQDRARMRDLQHQARGGRRLCEPRYGDRQGRALKAGDKVTAASHNKTLMLVNLGTRPIEQA